ncbi:MAG: hypothetical protein M0C28_28345 [Candidatus Moduliflexus flocculans]|nr:hypothetical protein [Candidatus Moduliflexus flocculans]
MKKKSSNSTLITFRAHKSEAIMKVSSVQLTKTLHRISRRRHRAVEGTNYQASKMEVFGARPDADRWMPA